MVNTNTVIESPGGQSFEIHACRVHFEEAKELAVLRRIMSDLQFVAEATDRILQPRARGDADDLRVAVYGLGL